MCFPDLGDEPPASLLTAEISLVLCDREEKAESLLDNMEKGLMPMLSCLVLFNPFSSQLVERGKQCGVEILELKEVMVRRTGGGVSARARLSVCLRGS